MTIALLASYAPNTCTAATFADSARLTTLSSTTDAAAVKTVR